MAWEEPPMPMNSTQLADLVNRAKLRPRNWQPPTQPGAQAETHASA
jgi:hypothetical protein